MCKFYKNELEVIRSNPRICNISKKDKDFLDLAIKKGYHTYKDLDKFYKEVKALEKEGYALRRLKLDLFQKKELAQKICNISNWIIISLTLLTVLGGMLYGALN